MQLLNRFPRYPLLHGPTKIEPLDRLSDLLKGPRIFVKRDDQNELGGGGNKLRKLEFLIGDARLQNADTLITSGARQSNHARLTAAAAARAGLNCELVLSRRVPRDDDDYLWNGNIVLNKILGCTLHDLPGEADAQKFINDRVEELTKDGRRVYVVPMGGSNNIGILGYARCAFEIVEQAAHANLHFTKIILPNGGGGTHAGLTVGLKLLNKNPRDITAFNVLYPQEVALQRTIQLAHEAGRLLQSDFSLSTDEIIINDSQLGAGYGIPTDAMLEAVTLLARTEGLLIDPVYGGKAFAGLIAMIRQGRYKKDENILFLMTGGLPGLYAYRSIF